VAHRVGVRRRIAQCGQEELGGAGDHVAVAGYRGSGFERGDYGTDA
jgi:hypothetical protein